MALATLDDLAAASGSINFGEDPNGTLGRRAQWLLDKATASVLNHMGTTETLIGADTDVWTANIVAELQAVICEVAASRLQGSPMADVGQYPEAYMSSLLQPRHLRDLDRLKALMFAASGGSQSLVVERDTDSSFFRHPTSFWGFFGVDGGPEYDAATFGAPYGFELY